MDGKSGCRHDAHELPELPAEQKSGSAMWIVAAWLCSPWPCLESCVIRKNLSAALECSPGMTFPASM